MVAHHAGSGSHTMTYSAGGVTWTGNGKAIFTADDCSVAYHNGLWVAGDRTTNSLAYSMDGIYWTSSENAEVLLKR